LPPVSDNYIDMSESQLDAPALLSRGMACLREGRFAEAKPLLEEALRLGLDLDAPPDERGMTYERPQTANCHLQLAAALVELGDLAGALAEAERALPLHRAEPSFTARGAIKRLSGDMQGALADLSRALELDPRSARARRHRSHVYEALGDLPAALADLARNLEDNPQAEPERGRFAELSAKLERTAKR
jgi:tetratricopeptide (TPR) repeat protein